MLDVEQADCGRRLETRGSMTVSGKCTASSSSSRNSRRIWPGRTEASAIARIRPGIDRAAR